MLGKELALIFMLFLIDFGLLSFVLGIYLGKYDVSLVNQDAVVGVGE